MGTIQVAFFLINLVAMHFMFFEFVGLAYLAHLLTLHDVSITFSSDVESTLTSIQDDGRLLYTNDVKYLDLLLLFPLFLLCMFQSLVGAAAPSKSQQVCVLQP